jgi:hypothetical protein
MRGDFMSVLLCKQANYPIRPVIEKAIRAGAQQSIKKEGNMDDAA